MTVICQDCKRLDLKGSPLGKSGFGSCKAKRMDPGSYLSASYPRECQRFSQAAQEVVLKRKQFMGDQ